jgi:hypothetical protein
MHEWLKEKKRVFHFCNGHATRSITLLKAVKSSSMPEHSDQSLSSEEYNALLVDARRHDHEQAVVLFGGRLNPSDLEISGPSIPLLEGTNAAVPVIDLATRLDATLVD